MAHHHELSVKDAEAVLDRFYTEHEYHEGFEVRGEGRSWSLFLLCPECNKTETVVVDNPEYRQAIGGLSADGVVLF